MLESISKELLVGRNGTSYRDFRATLTPKHGVVLTQFFAGYVAIALTAAALIASDVYYPHFFAIKGLVGGIVIGYGLAYLSLFFHEAVHFNLARDRKTNDLIAQLFIGTFLGQSIKNYREIHFDHHRFLGQANDPERTYFDSLTLRFVLESLFLMRAVRFVFLRGRVLAKKQDDRSAFRGNVALVVGVFFHLTILVGSYYLGLWSFGLAWGLGMLSFFPFFASIRQVLEHRPNAENSTESVSGIATNRIFGTGLFVSTFGAAGFNRHLLHHWEPQISCTRLGELEEFLAETPALASMEANSSTYGKTFADLFKI